MLVGAPIGVAWNAVAVTSAVSICAINALHDALVVPHTLNWKRPFCMLGTVLSK